MKCPKCDKEVSPEFNVCPWCGYKPKKCNKPEHQDVWLPSEARFCPRCGEPLSDEKAGGTETRETETRKSNDYPNENLEFDVEGVCFNMVFVEGGTFMMGAQSDDEDEENYDPEASYIEAPVHEVALSDYYIGETPVTQELWEAVMDNNPSYNPHYIKEEGEKPVNSVSWDDCQAFLKKLNRMLHDQLPRGCKFRLPTEAQWEFAARGGNESECYLYSGSDDIDDVAWYHGNSDNETYSVMEKEANELGLYDMSGNVWEWCQDWYDDYEDEVQDNPQGPKEGSDRVCRGGSWDCDAGGCRVTSRCSETPDYRIYNHGLRLVLQ